MSGHLYTLRARWRTTIGNPARTLESPSAAFITLFGKTARFEHIGMDSDHADAQGKRHYHGQMYAVFSTGKDKMACPLTPLDIESLSSTLSSLQPGYPDRAAVLAHLQPELAHATRELNAHSKTFAWLNPAAALAQRIA